MSLKHKKSSRCFYNKCEKFPANSMATEVAQASASNVGQNIKITDDGLKKCSQCHLASYCNRDCQRKDWKYNHKDECFHIKKVTEDLEKLEANYGSQGILEPPKILADDFKYHRGCCNICTDKKKIECANEPHQKLVHKKFTYAFAMWHMAEKYNSYMLYKKFFDYIAELARVSIKGTCDLKNYLVMALMSLGRDQDAYNMIKFWIVTFNEKDNETLAKMANELNPGEWLHLPNQNMKEDLFELVDSKPPQFYLEGHSQGSSSLNDYKHNYFMAALVAMKINIILKLEEALQDFKKHDKTFPSNDSIIEANLVKELKEQRKHLDGYVQTLEFHEFLYEIVLQRECPQGVNCYNYDLVMPRMPHLLLGGSNHIIQPRIIWTYFNRLFHFKPESLKMILNAK